MLFPKLAPNFDPQCADIWPLLKILEETLFWNRYVSAQNGHDHNNSNKVSQTMLGMFAISELSQFCISIWHHGKIIEFCCLEFV